MSDIPRPVRMWVVENRRVVKCELSDDGDTATFEDGWSMGFSTKVPVRPYAGCIMEMSMDGNMRVGYSIDGVLCEDPNPIQVHMRQEVGALERKLEQARKAQAGLDKMAKRIAALPPQLRERIGRFRAANLHFVEEYEAYEMACCEEAARIVAKFPTDKAIVDFSKLGYEEQKKALPEMDGGHSGNTWGFAIMLARALLDGDKTLVLQCPPAITPLTGKACHGDWMGVTPPQIQAVL